MRRAPVNPRQLLTWLGLFAGCAGLILQFFLSMQAYLASGRDIPGALGTFFTFYTILTNIVLVMIYLSELLPTRRLDLFRHPVTRGSMVACTALVGIYVFLVLRHLTAFTGLFDVADKVLHYVSPSIYLLWWAAAQRHGQLHWRHLPLMLAPTFIYFVYVMARGLWVNEYPYPFMNMAERGYAEVLLGALYMSIALALLAGVAVVADRLFAQNWNSVHD